MSPHIFTYEMDPGGTKVHIAFGVVQGCAEYDAKLLVSVMGDEPEGTGYAIPKEHAERFKTQWALFRQRIDRGGPWE